MQNRPQISPALRSTAVVVENAQSHKDIETSIDPQLQITSNIPEDTVHQSALQSQAFQRLNKEVISNTQRKVSAMEKRYNEVNKVKVFEKDDLVHQKIPVKDRCSTDNKRMFCRVVEVKHGNRYSLQCQYGILEGFYRTKNMDRLAATISHQIPPFMKGSHRRLSLRKAARLQSPAELISVHCGCKGNCSTIRCKCFKAKVECTLHCHGQNDVVQCRNNGDLAAPSGTFNLKRKTTPTPSHNHK